MKICSTSCKYRLIASLILLESLIFISGCATVNNRGGRGTRNFRPYVFDEELPEPKELAERDAIEFKFSRLDSIRPYIHRFSSGVVEVPAPSLDPRECMPPDSLVGEYLGTKPNSAGGDILGLPEKDFIVLGEVGAPISLPYPISRSQTPLTDLPHAPNLKPWVNLKPLNWEPSFKRLRKNAAAMGADAVIEVFCAKGVNAYWIPPSTYSPISLSVPVYNQDGRVTYNYLPQTALIIPGGVSTSDWRLIGLAVEWK